MQKHLKHLPHYFSLIAIFFAGVIGFYTFSYDRFFQIGVAVAMASAYVSWGIIHHILHKDICLSIVLEYLSIAILGLVMVFTLIFRT